MRTYSVDYLDDRDAPPSPGTLVNRGFWVYRVPRLVLWCRLFGHKPVVDGTEGGGPDGGYRWVCCDRCGIRPDPQGRPDPQQYRIGQPYDGPYQDAPPAKPRDRSAALRKLKNTHYPPGPWPQKPVADVGGQVVIGRTFGGAGVELKLGNCGSEQVLAFSVRLHHLGALYLHTERHGQWLQRRLNPTGYNSRVFELAVGDRRLRWKIWAKRDEWSRDTPRWQDGSIRIDPREILLGPVRNTYTDVGEPVDVVVRMPHGDDHTVTVQLQQVHTGRERGRKQLTWTADWRCATGIPTKPGDRGHILASGVDISHTAALSGAWPAEAAAAIAAQMTEDRVRYDYQPASPVS
jgi:hypothetical protein